MFSDGKISWGNVESAVAESFLDTLVYCLFVLVEYYLLCNCQSNRYRTKKSDNRNDYGRSRCRVFSAWRMVSSMEY